MIAVFLIGCATASVVARLVVPPVRAGTNPLRWEQRCVPSHDNVVDQTIVGETNYQDLNHPKGWNQVLEKYGAEGWELAETTFSASSARIKYVCFKRPL